MSDNQNIKCKVKMIRQLYPKSTPLKAGEFGIIRVRVLEEIDGTPLVDEKDQIVIKGNFCELDYKMPYTICAIGEENEKYNTVTYKITYISSEIDFSNDDDKKVFLQSILTPKQYKSLESAFDDPCEVISNKDLEKLKSVKGIGEATACRLIGKYYETIDYAKIVVQLNKYGLTNNLIQRLLATYKSPELVIEIIKNDIYRLAEEVEGIGFIKCDEIALRGGMSPTDPKRVEAYIRHVLKEEGEKGNSWSFVQDIVNRICDDLRCYDEGIIKQALASLLEKRVIWANPDRSVIALTKYYNLEMEIAKEIKRLNSVANKLFYSRWKDIVAGIEAEQGWKYTTEQIKGIKKVLDSQVSVVTGLAGCGKTAVTNAMVKTLAQYKITQCALSGRAAQKMKECNGLESNTIHKTLGYTGFNYKYNEGNQLETDIVLIDEASMISGDIFLGLLKAIKTGTKLVIIGDKGQLPAIGNCNVFFDLMDMGVPVVELTTVHRQSETSAIITKSIDIRKQRQLFNRDYAGTMILGEKMDLEINVYTSPNHLREVIVEKFKDNLAKVNGDITKVQIVVPIRQRGNICTYNLNNDIQALLRNENQPYIRSMNYKYYVGDKVINMKNKVVVTPEGESLAIFNGNVGIVESINVEDSSMIVNFGKEIGRAYLKKRLIDSNLELAYAITCHKLQGSSAQRVIVGCDFSAFMMLTAEWLYTAITRAERYCCVVSTNEALRYGISKVITDKKRTFLQFVEDIDRWEAA